MKPEEIRRFLVALNQTWQQGALDALAAYYHPDVVLLPPDLGPAIRGRDAVVASYREFLQAAQLERFEPTSLEVFSFPGSHGGSHVAHLNFEVDYTLAGERYLEKGLEVYAVQETDVGLQIIWRQQAVLDSRLAEKSESR
ncbi:MAG TPA: nuclear transport factor 2 family protein [Pseudomonadales bacterium]